MKFSTRDITLTGMFVAFTIVAAMVSRFWGSVVPFSLLPFVSIFAGSILGKRLGAMAIMVYVILGLIGIPVFASAPYGGIAYVFNPTFGFLVGFILAAYVTGWILELKRTFGAYATAAIAGLFPIYIVGLVHFWVIFNLYMGKSVSWWWVLEKGFLPFILKDIAVVLFAAFLATGIARRLPQSIFNKTA